MYGYCEWFFELPRLLSAGGNRTLPRRLLDIRDRHQEGSEKRVGVLLRVLFLELGAVLMCIVVPASVVGADVDESLC